MTAGASQPSNTTSRTKRSSRMRTTGEMSMPPRVGRMLRIGAVIFVERESQKAIVIGKGGTRLREIGTKSRIQMERMFDSKVFLETWVRVREGWSDDEAALKAFGYTESP